MCAYEAGMSICAQMHAGIGRERPLSTEISFWIFGFFSTSKSISRSKKRSIAKRVPPLESQENSAAF